MAYDGGSVDSLDFKVGFWIMSIIILIHWPLISFIPFVITNICVYLSFSLPPPSLSRVEFLFSFCFCWKYKMGNALKVYKFLYIKNFPPNGSSSV